MRRVLAHGLFWGLLAAGCGETAAPVAPTPAISLTGTWVGSVDVSGASTRLTWTLSQAGQAVTGPVMLALPSGTVLLNGFLTGTLTGSQLAYTISVGPGGIPAQPSCTGQIAGTMTATIAAVSTLAGTSTVTGSSCTPPFPGGPLTLTRQ